MENSELGAIAKQHFTTWTKLLDYGLFGLLVQGLERQGLERRSKGVICPNAGGLPGIVVVSSSGSNGAQRWRRADVERSRRGRVEPRASGASETEVSAADAWHSRSTARDGHAAASAGKAPGKPARPREAGGDARKSGRSASGRRRRGGRDGRNNDPVYAALDLGTNNCRLLIARPTRRGFQVVDAFSRIIRLGEGVSVTGVIVYLMQYKL